MLASDAWWFHLAITGAIIPIDELLKAVDDPTGDFDTILYEGFRYNGAHWAVPNHHSTLLFYYNRTHSRKAQVPDRAPRTWAEFAEWAPEIKQANSNQPGYLSAYQYPDLDGYAGYILQNVLWGFGSGWSKEWEITAHDEKSVAAMQWVQDSIVKDG